MCSRSRSALVLAIALGACAREKRDPHPSAEDWGRGAALTRVEIPDLRPGGGAPLPPVPLPEADNAWALSEGKRLYSWFNCVGCHAHGGGGMGPALMDDKWIYGSDPQNIYATIVEGRPNGMPAWRGKIPEPQIWQLVAYVRSLAGLVPKLAAPSRDDHMQVAPQESNAAKGHPIPAEAEPPS
ncbi:MAG TPA: c-type cytochrome [Polyangia bacterium]|nr:c-type cytochrome [Polyangia bacterium]